MESTDEKQRLLFITSYLPDRKAGGPSNRVHNILKTLSAHYSIHLLFINHGWRKRQKSVSDLPHFCNEFSSFQLHLIRDLLLIIRLILYRLKRPEMRIPPDVYITSNRLKALIKKFIDCRFDIIFAFRSAMAPYASSIKGSGRKGRLFLDTDDIESQTMIRFADLCRKKELFTNATQYESLANKYINFEEKYYPLFDKLFVCSKIDKENLLGNCLPDDKISVLPNVVELLKSKGKKTRLVRDYFIFSFLGSLGYFPNYEALEYFFDKVMPIIRSNAAVSIKINIAGKGLPIYLKKRLKNTPESNLMGWVDDLDEFYRNSDAIIIPIRAGGGTRIKVLEAFASKKPVISTSIGIEGIEAVPDTHFLLGNSTEDFANQCLKIIDDEDLRVKLSENSFQLVKKSYTIDRLKEILDPNNLSY